MLFYRIDIDTNNHYSVWQLSKRYRVIDQHDNVYQDDLSLEQAHSLVTTLQQNLLDQYTDEWLDQAKNNRINNDD